LTILITLLPVSPILSLMPSCDSVIHPIPINSNEFDFHHHDEWTYIPSHRAPWTKSCPVGMHDESSAGNCSIAAS
jgi:hypothetical protein